jgi:hypothetical protein
MTVLDPILCHRLKDEIDISIATAQAFLDYKRGDMTFDRFVMDAMEIASASPLYIEKYHREFIEAQRSNDLPHSSSGSSLTAICDYEGLFNAVVYKVEDTLTDEELDDLWEFGKDYSTSMFQKLVY